MKDHNRPHHKYTLPYGILLIIVAIMMFSCEEATSPEPEPEPEPEPGQNEPVLPPLPEDPYAIFQDLPGDENAGFVAVTAISPRDENENREWSDRIYLVNYNVPSLYWRISPDDDHFYDWPAFFPDRTKLLMRDRYPGLDAFLMHDLVGDTSFYLTTADTPTGKFRGIGTVICPNQQGVFTALGLDPSGTYITHYYDFQTRERKYIAGTRGVTLPVGITGSDTLIILTSDTTITGGPPGLYFTDFDGNFLSRIENPYLDSWLEDDYRWEQSGDLCWNARWNEELGLFAVSKEEQPPHYPYTERHIYVTNLDGTYFHQFTSGPHDDQVPEWGPGNRYLLFNRSEHPLSEFNVKVMKVDLKTGEVSQLFNAEEIDSAAGLLFPSY